MARRKATPKEPPREERPDYSKAFDEARERSRREQQDQATSQRRHEQPQ